MADPGDGTDRRGHGHDDPHADADMDTDTLAVFADLRETALEPLLDAAMAALAPVLAHLAAATGAFPLDGRHDDPDPDPRATPQQEETR